MKRYNVVLRRGFNNAKVLDTKLALDGKWVKYEDVNDLLHGLFYGQGAGVFSEHYEDVNVADTLPDAQAEFLRSVILK